MGKISGPLVDRIDIHVEVPGTHFEELSSQVAGTSSTEMRELVTVARKVQFERFSGSGILYNAQMSSRQIRQHCPLDDPGKGLLKSSFDELGLSARAHDKVLRLSRTIADLDAASDIRAAHLADAINYRMLDRDLWN